MKQRMLLAVLCTTMVAESASATRIRSLALTEIRDVASAVLVVDVLAADARIGGAEMVWTDYRVRIVEAVRGEYRVGSTLVLPFAGGRVGRTETGIDGVPSLVVGKRYLVFLDSAPRRPVPAIGWGQGIFAIDDDTGRIVSLTGEELWLDTRGALMVRSLHERGTVAGRRLPDPVVTGANGGIVQEHAVRVHVPPAARRHATLDDVRDFVRAARSAGEEQR